MTYRFMAVALLALAVSCKTKDQTPAPPDSTPDSMLTVDSVGPNAGDSVDMWSDSTEAAATPDEFTAEDTVLTKNDSAYIAKRRSLRGASRGGLPVGATQYPVDRWCTPNINTTTFNAAPSVVAAAIRKGSDCGISGLIIPPRRLFTANGQNQGPFVEAKWNAMIDQYAAVLTPSFIATYGPAGNRTILGFQDFDDHKCPFCWGSYGTIVPSSTVARLIRYGKKKIPGLPHTLRIEPSLLADYRGWQVGDIDATSEQWTTKKRPPKMAITGSVTQQKAWYKYQDSIARAVTKNPWHIRQVSIGDITPPDGPQITVQQLRDFMLTSMTYMPENNCGNVSWVWENFFLSGGYPAAWFDISAKAKTLPWHACSGKPLAVGDSTPAPAPVSVETTVAPAPASVDTAPNHNPHKPRHK